MKRVLVLTMIIGLVMASAALAAVPEKISYQGVLTNANGTVVPNGNYNLTLSLYDTASGGTALWTEAQLAAVNNGVFNVVLGSVVPIHIAFDKQLYLGVAVAGGSELTPRTMLTATPYALNAPVTASVSSSATTDIQSSFTNYEDEQVSLTVPGPGYVVVQSEVWLRINHAAGEEMELYIVHDTTATGAGPNFDMTTPYEWQPTFPAASALDATVPVQTVFAITAPGTYTFYLNGELETGSSTEEFYYASTVATWYPATNPVQTVAAMRHPAKGLNKFAK